MVEREHYKYWSGRYKAQHRYTVPVHVQAEYDSAIRCHGMGSFHFGDDGEQR